MRTGLLLSLALLLCACHEPLRKHYVPDYQPSQPVAGSTPAAEPEFARALEHYAADGSTDALQEVLQNHPAETSGRAAEQILALDRRLGEMQQQLGRQRRLHQECQQQNRQAEEQAARLKEQLDALAKSLIRQEKRLP